MTMELVEAIDRRPLHREVADRLRDLIIRGELRPAQRLNERLLTKRFGISRTPLREAFTILAADGLVTLLPNRGAMVATVTAADAEDMFQVMAVLEALGGELACQRASDVDIAEVRALHEQMRGYHDSRDLDAYFDFNQRIHQKIVDSAGNRELTDTYKRISRRIRRARYLANLSRERWDHAMDEHEEILEAFVQRDSGKLKALLAVHLRNKYEVVRAWLAENERTAVAGAAKS
jgi:DNA-binding GntR family transcriptional regulator